MTGPRARHPEFEELISASLAGDLSSDERRRLDAHLDTCDACRGTLAAFADGRRIVAGVRHVPVPRDLHARVRTGIERGRFAAVPWYRRPAALVAGIGGGLAAVAGVLLGIVLLSDPEPRVGDATPAPSTTAVASVSPSPSASFPTGPTPTPGAATPLPSPSEPAPTASPAPTTPPSPEPDAYLALTGPPDNRALTIRDGATDALIAEADTPPGPPTAAALSPDGQWIAYITPVGESGMHEVRATRIGEGTPSDDADDLPPMDSPVAVGDTVVLGESVSGDPFLEHLAWSSPRGNYLAFTLTDQDGGGTDVFLFEPEIGAARPLTNTGNAYAGSWIPSGSGTSFLWVSVAGDRPVSHLQMLHDSAGSGEPVDPAADPLTSLEGVFQPQLSPNGRFVLYWDGAMELTGDAWQFTSGAQPYLAQQSFDGGRAAFERERRVFTDLTVGRDAFTSASMTWGEDGLAYAIWNVRWTGPVQAGEGEDDYPDERRVYFTRATDSRGMTRGHAIDRADIPEGWSVVDVKISPTGEHLLITAAEPLGGTLDVPTAQLLLVERNTGNEADEVERLRAEEGQWFGPAAFDRLSAGDR